jgi:hypothetical protein
MQKAIIALLSCITLALAVLNVAQRQKMRATQAELQAVRAAQVEFEKSAEEGHTAKLELQELKRVNTQLDQRIKEFTAVTTTLRTKEANQSSNLTALASRLRNASADSGSPEDNADFGKEMGNMVQKMMKDPAMREMIRSQQQAAVKMMYNGLFKEMKVTPEEKDKLMGILTDFQMKTVENAKGLFGGTDNDADTATQTQSIADLKKQADADIEELLGQERNKQFKDYQSNVGERMQIDQLQTKLQAENVGLQDDQVAQLLAAMKQESAAFPPPIPSNANENPANLKELMTSDNIDKQLKWMTDYNSRLADRASQILTPEQLKIYRGQLEQQAAMQEMGLKMAKGMFGGKSAPTPPAK